MKFLSTEADCKAARQSLLTSAGISCHLICIVIPVLMHHRPWVMADIVVVAIVDMETVICHLLAIIVAVI